MWDKERHYLERRVEEELDLAQSANHPAAVKAHYLLLSLYLNRLFPEERRSNVYSLMSRH